MDNAQSLQQPWPESHGFENTGANVQTWLRISFGRISIMKYIYPGVKIMFLMTLLIRTLKVEPQPSLIST